MSLRSDAPRLLLLVLIPAVAGAQTITITSPTGAEVVASGSDYATEVLGNRWDFDSPSDISTMKYEWASASIGNGVFTGLTNGAPGNPSNLYLLYQGADDANRWGPEGTFFPIDTTLYRRFSMRMYTDRAGYMRFIYFRQPEILGDTAGSSLIAVSPGWHVYDVDLVALGGYCESGSQCTIPGWGGTVIGFAVVPNMTASSTVVIDWVRLAAGNTSATQFPITWTATDPTGQAVLDLFVDDDADIGNGTLANIASALDPSTGSFSWGVNGMETMPYHVLGVIGTSYAGNTLLDEWDMSQATDVTATGWSSGGVSGGRFSGVTASGAAALFPRVSGGRPIDAEAYRYVRIRMDVQEETYYRVYFRRNGSENYKSTPFLTTTPGMREYLVDLSTNPDWYGTIESVRLNPSITTGVSVVVDSIEVTSSAQSAATAVDYSSGPLRVNVVPQIALTDPDASGGEDFATTVLGNPWDMDDPADVPMTAGLTTYSFGNGEFHGTSSFNDPGVYLVYGNTLVDAAKYHLWTVRFAVDNDVNGQSSISRIFWRPDQNSGTPSSATNDYVVYAGYQTMTTDLLDVELENNPPYNLPIPWQGFQREVRFDPHEESRQCSFHIDYVKLAAEDASDGQFTIRWTDSDSDHDASISLYWDTSKTGFNGTPIVQGIPEDDPANAYTWASGTAPQGPIWIYARITDGLDSTQRYATGVLMNNAAGDTSAPYLTLHQPEPSATGVAPATPIVVHLRDTGSGVDAASIVMTVDGGPVVPQRTGTGSDVILTYDPPASWSFGQQVAVGVSASDLAGNAMADSWSFTATTATDSDGDGMPDQFEVASSLDRLNPNGLEGGAGDPDEEGVASLAEYGAGTDPTSWAQLLLGPGPGSQNPPSLAIAYRDGTPVSSFAKSAYTVNRWGVNVGAGDIESPTRRAIITGPGPGDVFGPQIRAFRPDTTDVAKVNYYAYGTLKFGAHAQAGDVDGDGMAELVTTPGAGAVFGPHVRGWNFDGQAVASIARINFFCYSTLKYGAHVSGGELDADGFDEILTAPGPGQVFGPVIRGFNYDGSALSSIAKINFIGVPGTTQYGAEVASGQVDGDGYDEILTGPGPGPSHGATLAGWNYDGSGISPLPVTATAFTTLYGMTVGAGDLDGDRIDEIACGVGPDPAGGTYARAYDFDGGTLTPMSGGPFTAYVGLNHGVRVASGRMGF